MNDHDEAHLYDGDWSASLHSERRYQKALVAAEAYGASYPLAVREHTMNERELILLRMAELQRRLKKLEERPIEPEGDASVIYFDKQFEPDGRKYHYAFVKAAGRWSGTGPKAPKSYTWDELMDWLEGSGPMPIIYLMKLHQTLNIVRVVSD